MRPRPDPRRSFRPLLEALETRALLSVCTVDRLTDVGEGEKMAGDLRYCIEQAQDGDSIQFAVKGILNLTRALPTLTRSISIEGPGSDLLTVRRDTGGSYRVVTVNAGATVSISGLTVSNGVGGVSNAGALTVSNTTITGNTTGSGESGGSGILNSGTLMVSDSTISGNTSDHGGHGAGIASFGMLTISNSMISRNTAIDGHGGGVFGSGTLTVGNSTISENSATVGGGGGGVYFVAGTLDVTNSTISGNGASRDGGGGILVAAGTLRLSNSTISRNTTGSLGGGISNYGTLVLNDSTVRNNSARSGAGIFIGTNSVVTVTRSTIADNSTTEHGGGGIDNYGTLTLSNCTVSGNSAAENFGGGISIPAGRVSIFNSTISRNSTGTGGGVFNASGASLTVRNTIVAGNIARTSADVGGGVTSQGYNLIGNSQGGSGYQPTDLLNVNALLGPLQDNGGPTPTHALLPGSPAIDAGDNKDAQGFDQRGQPRVTGNVIDIGAYEVQPGPAAFFYLAAPESALASVPFDLFVIAFDADGYVATNYTGTVAFYSATDPDAVVPDAYTFTAENAGWVYLAESTVLYAEGPQEVWAYDVETFAVGLALVEVMPGEGPNPFGGYRPDAAALVALLLSEPARVRPGA